jgi:hypothetical protein
MKVYNLLNNISIRYFVKVQEFELHGTWPRHFAIQGNLLIIADQKEATIQVLHINQISGLLTTGEIYDTPDNPTFVGFYTESTSTTTNPNTTTTTTTSTTNTTITSTTTTTTTTITTTKEQGHNAASCHLSSTISFFVYIFLWYHFLVT